MVVNPSARQAKPSLRVTTQKFLSTSRLYFGLPEVDASNHPIFCTPALRTVHAAALHGASLLLLNGEFVDPPRYKVPPSPLPIGHAGTERPGL